MDITFEAKAVHYVDGGYSARVFEYHDGVLMAETWIGEYDSEYEALDIARQRIAEYWLLIAQESE